jgi:hypothetical protein
MEFDMTEELLGTWRDEITGELERARQDLAHALIAAEVADRANKQTHADHAIYRDLLAKRVQSPLADALAARIRLVTPDLRAAGGELSRAQGAVANARARIGDLELALRQVTQLLGRDEEDLPRAA